MPRKTDAVKQREDVERVAFELYHNRLLLGKPGDERSDWAKAVKIVRSPLRKALFVSNRPLIKLEKGVWEPILDWSNNQAILSLLGVIGNLGLIVAVAAYIGSEKQRRDAEVLNAWQTITSAYGQSGSGGRIQALEFLNASPGANWRRKFPWVCAPHPLCLWRQESLAGINLSAPNEEGGGVYLADANFKGADLSRANLQGANLSRANLEKANLWHTDLQGANLWHTDLQGAYLGKTNLQGADLPRANLEEANLWSANLQEADLEQINLQGADLEQANLQGADLGFANLQGALNTTQDQLNQAKLCFTTLPQNITLDPNRDCKELGLYP